MKIISITVTVRSAVICMGLMDSCSVVPQAYFFSFLNTDCCMYIMDTFIMKIIKLVYLAQTCVFILFNYNPQAVGFFTEL